MNKQQFAIKLLYYFMPYPMSKMLPRLFRRLLRLPSSETPADWAPAALPVISQVASDVVDYANSLLDSVKAVDLPDLPAELPAAVEDKISAVESSSEDLQVVIDNIEEATDQEILDVLDDILPIIDDLDNVTVDLISELPPAVIPVTPPYTPPLPPIYIGPPVPGPAGPTSRPPTRRWLRRVWFLDEFTEIDPGVWTDWSEGTGVNSIVDNQLKMLSAQAGDYAYLTTANDDNIPETFRLEFNLTMLSGTGEFVVTVRTGVHHIMLIFDPPNILKFRQKNPDGYKSIDVGNYMNERKLWRFFYNGTLCDIYSGNVLVDSELTVYESASSKGALSLSCDNVLALYLDNFKITDPV